MVKALDCFRGVVDERAFYCWQADHGSLIRTDKYVTRPQKRRSLYLGGRILTQITKGIASELQRSKFGLLHGHEMVRLLSDGETYEPVEGPRSALTRHSVAWVCPKRHL